MKGIKGLMGQQTCVLGGLLLMKYLTMNEIEKL
jgi:hypothetical protein